MSVTEMVPISVLPAAETGGRSAVYRIFGGEQQLLYIGSSERPRQRWHEHRNRAVWWTEARMYSLTWLANRDAAYEAEAQAIAAERPAFNQVWQPQQVPAPRKSDGPSEEAQRVFDAIDALGQIADPTERAKEVGAVLKNLPQRNKALKELRQAAVLEMLAREGATYRTVAKDLGVHFTTVQAIVKGHSASGTVRPKRKPQPDDAGAEG